MKTALTVLFTLFWTMSSNAQVYINEVDYDQPSTDFTEFIELIGPSGASLNNYTIELVTGSNGTVYTTFDLSGLLIPSDNISGYGFFVIGPASGVNNVDFTPAGWKAQDNIQNGAPDGILLKLSGNIVDGFSYEGVLSGNANFTAGMAISAIDDNVSAQKSIGRISLGFNNANQDQYFAGSIAANSPGEINTAHGQVLGGDPPPSISQIARSPKIPNDDQNVMISAEINDDSDITAAELYYKINDSDSQIVAMNNSGGSTYSAEIPETAYTNGDRLEYWLVAWDDAPQSGASSHYYFFAGNTDISALHAADTDGVLLYAGYEARVTGVATVETGTFSTADVDVYIQDATAGINVFSFGIPLPFQMDRGHEYMVTGEVAQYRGKTEIIPANVATDVIDNGFVGEPDALIHSIAELLSASESYEGLLVLIPQVSNTTNGDAWPVTGSSANVTITDNGSVDSLILRIDSDTNIDGTAEPSWPKDVRGIFSQFAGTTPPFNSGYQIIPRDIADIDIFDAIEAVSTTGIVRIFKLHPAFPNPFNPATNLEFDVPAPSGNTSLITLEIFNILGQKISTLIEQELKSGTYKVTWNGRNKNGAPAASGVYFALLKMNDAQIRMQKLILMK